MRVLFAVVPTRPHLFPIVPLAWACRTAGHDVRIACPPLLAEEATRTGLAVVPVGDDAVDMGRLHKEDTNLRPWPLGWVTNPGLLDEQQRARLVRVGGNLIRVAVGMIDPLLDFARRWKPHVVVHDYTTFAGDVAGAVLGVPNVRHLPGAPDIPRFETGGVGTDPLPEYVALFGRFGLRPPPGPSVIIDPCPPSMCTLLYKPVIQCEYVPYNGPGTDPGLDNVVRDRQRVCITWGHTAYRHGPSGVAPFREALDALSDLEVEIIIVTTADQAAMLGELPPRARVVQAPLHTVLPFCDAVVHQAGAGTIMTAAACGIPQLAITSKPEPTNSAHRLAAVGAGSYLVYPELRDDPSRRARIAGEMRRILDDPAYTKAARWLAEEISGQPTPADLVPELEALVEGRPIGHAAHR